MRILRRSCQRLEHVRNEDIRGQTRSMHNYRDYRERVAARQLIWYGHVMKMRKEGWLKHALNYAPSNRRKRGKPALIWIDSVHKTIRNRAIEEEAWQDRRR